MVEVDGTAAGVERLEMLVPHQVKPMEVRVVGGEGAVLDVVVPEVDLADVQERLDATDVLDSLPHRLDGIGSERLFRGDVVVMVGVPGFEHSLLEGAVLELDHSFTIDQMPVLNNLNSLRLRAVLQSYGDGLAPRIDRIVLGDFQHDSAFLNIGVDPGWNISQLNLRIRRVGDDGDGHGDGFTFTKRDWNLAQRQRVCGLIDNSGPRILVTGHGRTDCDDSGEERREPNEAPSHSPCSERAHQLTPLVYQI